ncbi:MAG: hypothetical protein MUC72_01690 [Acidobacteria bacterium]|jgi:hypothetical protein|nr:hypothetical protein [Acidobacteriota bacterium]
MKESVMRVFEQALAVSGKGMLALFAFMLIFFVMLILVDKVFPGGDAKS